MKKILNNKVIFVVVLFCFVFLRFLKVPELFYFGIDEEYQSLLALSIIKDFHVIWIGLSAANTGFYIGPGLVYLHSFLLWLSKNDPIILAYTASLIGVITAIVLYFVVKNLFNQKTALLSSILYALSSFVIVYDRRFWNSTLVPLTTILFYYALVKFKKNSRWIIFIAFLLGLSFHIHASLFIFIPIVLIAIFRNIVKHPPSLRSGHLPNQGFGVQNPVPSRLAGTGTWVMKKIKVGKLYLLISAAVFLIVYSPLIVFDLVHNFDNLKTPLRMLKGLGKSGGGSMIVDNIITLKTTLSRFWLNFNQPELLSIVLFIVSITLLILFILKRKNYQERILSVILGFYCLMFVFYPGKVLDYYYLGFLPFFAIVCGRFFEKINNYFLLVFIGIFAVANSVVVLNRPIDEGLAVKKELVVKTMSVVNNRSFSLDTNQKYLYFGGWRYLFEVYGKKPDQSQADEMFGWIYPKEISQEKPELRVIIADAEISIKEKLITVIKSGIYRAYVFENNQ